MKLLDVKDYANKCGVTIQAIYHRIKIGQIKDQVIDGVSFIDASNYPPGKMRRGRKASKA